MAEDSKLSALIEQRFGRSPDQPSDAHEIERLRSASNTLEQMAGRSSCRAFNDKPVSTALLQNLAAVALSAASKSDMQQRDIIIVHDPDIRQKLFSIVSDQTWTHAAHTLLVFCGNNRRQRQIHASRGHAFVNDHLDAFFNAAVDAGIALQAFMTAAEATGLGCCPISGLRNDAQKVSDVLCLPDHVFPVAGLAVGWPAREGITSPRLNLQTTIHVDTFSDSNVSNEIAQYDSRRHAQKPFRTQRSPERFGTLPAEQYGWSEDKARQYATPERETFGTFVKAKGFKLE